MICKDVHKKYDLFQNDQLSKHEMESMEQHISACADCKWLIDEVNKTMDIANNKELLSVDPFMFTRVQQQIINESTKTVRLWGKFLQPIAASVVIIIGLTIGIGLGSKFYNDSLKSSSESREEINTFSSEEVYFEAIDYSSSLEAFLLAEE